MQNETTADNAIIKAIDWYAATPEQLAAYRDLRRFVPSSVFDLVRAWSANPTADFVCVRNLKGKREFLLTRRVERPWAGQWFIPGGRIAAGRHPKEGLKANCKRELGFIPEDAQIQFLDWHPILNPESQSGGEPYFTQMNVFLVNLSEDDCKRLTLDLTASQMAWFSTIDSAFPQPVIEILTKAGFQCTPGLD